MEQILIGFGTFKKWLFEIRRWLVSRLAFFHRKSELVSIYCVLLPNFKGPFRKIKG
jgi:hypothetical protein